MTREDEEVSEADVFDEARAERVRAHAKHGEKSMEAAPVDAPKRLSILVEEVGEVAKEFNDAAIDERPVDLARLRKELLQVTAMAGAWADRCAPNSAALRARHETTTEDTARLDWLNGRLNWFTTQGPAFDPKHANIREAIDAARGPAPAF